MVASSGKAAATAGRQKRDWYAVRRYVTAAIRPAAFSVALFLFSFVRIFQIPSPFAAALLISMPDKPPVVLLAGLAAGAGLRALWQIELDIWQYTACAGLWLLLQKCRPRTSVEASVLGGLVMLPRLIAALFGGKMLEALYSFASLSLAMLFSAVMRCGMETARQGNAVRTSQERCCLYMLPLVLTAGLGFFRLGVINLGHLMAVFGVCVFAWVSGPAGGMLAGLTCGLALAFTGHSSLIALSLSLCGLLCGLHPAARSRWLAVPACVAANWAASAILANGSFAMSLWACAVGSLLYALLPQGKLEKIKPYLQNHPTSAQPLDGSYISQRIGHMRHAIQRLAQALPEYSASEISTGEEMKTLLCAQCVNREICWGRRPSRTERMLGEMVELCRTGEKIDETTLPALADHGCLRVHEAQHLARDAMNRRNQRSAHARKAHYEREILLTHLAALSATLGELGQMTQGESYDDLRAAHIISKAMDELNIPAKLRYARRVEGHLQAAIQTGGIAQKTLNQLLYRLETQEDLSMSVSLAEKGIIELEELPLYSASVGMATLCADGTTDGDCGDAVSAKRCEGGRLLLMLCDGMGHGKKAHEQSEKTIELLLLLLEAGYTRRQAITAVNGIMLAAGEEERFSTVDLADVDLWTGEVSSEKLGACASWIIRGNHMKKIEASSLPLGIMQEAVPTATQYRLHSGDILVLMSDGVADVFATDAQLRAALAESVYIQPQRMADTLLRRALMAAGGTPRDDMSVMVLLLMNRQQAK